MKKRLVLMIIAFSMLLSMFSSAALAADSESAAINDSWAVIAAVDGKNIKTIQIDGDTYLFLPASANLDALTLCFESADHDGVDTALRGKKGSANLTEAIAVNTIAEMDEASRYTVEVVTKEGARFPFFIMQGSAIPTLYLHSDYAAERREWVDSSKKHETTGSMELITADGAVIYDGALTQIKTRGNTTFKYYPKKAYQIKLETKTDLLGTGEKGKTWVLLANYGDATLLHDKFFKDFAADLGMDFVASSDWVNLYYDGEYRGVYLLGEKVSVGSTGVDITDMEEAYEAENANYGDDMEIAEAVNSYGQTYYYTENIVEPETITGGYLIEKNHNRIDEASGFFTEQGIAFNVKSPEWAGQEAMEYISEYYQAFENAVYATDPAGNYTGYNTETGKYYYEYCNLESLVQTYLIQQLSLNVDAYVSSFFFYKDVDGVMYAGPVWDMDNTCGTGWGEEIAPTRNYVILRYLGEALCEIPHFKAAVEEYFAYYFLPRVERLIEDGGLIDEQITMLSDNAAMNYVLWPYVRVGDPANESHLWAAETDYATVTEDMKAWMARRLEVMKDTFHVSDTLKYFDDVSYSDWEYEAVCYATANGILNGVTEESFNPDGTATRGMVLTILARLDGQDTTPGAGERYYQPGVEWAVANGISDGTNPDKAISRQQLAVMLYRYAGEPESDGSLDAYGDGNKVSAYAVDAMKWAAAEGIFQGNSAGMLNPTATATRAHIAQVMMNYLK